MISTQTVACRSVLFHNLGTTLHDAGIGYLAGIVLALAVSCVFVLQRPVEETFMPVALMLRSVPLVAMTPLITLSDALVRELEVLQAASAFAA